MSEAWQNTPLLKGEWGTLVKFFWEKKNALLPLADSLPSAVGERRRPLCFSGLRHNERTEVAREGRSSFGPGKRMFRQKQLGQRLLIGQRETWLLPSVRSPPITCNATHHTNRKPTGTQRLPAAEGSRSGHCENRPSFHQWQAATYYLRWLLLSLLFSLLPSTWRALGPEKKKGVKGKIKPLKFLEVVTSLANSEGKRRNDTEIEHDIDIVNLRLGWTGLGVAATDRKAIGSAWRYH